MDKKVQQQIFNHMRALKDSTAEEMMRKEMERLHRQAIDALSPQRRNIYLMSREEEMSYGQIAEKLGISKNTVRNIASEALQGIREYISKHPDLACLAIAIIIAGLGD